MNQYMQCYPDIFDEFDKIKYDPTNVYLSQYHAELLNHFGNYLDYRYPNQRPSTLGVSVVNSFLSSDAYKDLCKQFKLHTPLVLFRNCRGALGLYIAASVFFNGSPVILIDINKHITELLIDGCHSNHDIVAFENQIIYSIRHELAHAFLERIGTPPKDHNESVIESFACYEMSIDEFIKYAKSVTQLCQ